MNIIQITLEDTKSSNLKITVDEVIGKASIRRSTYIDPTIRLLETDEQVVDGMAHSIRLALKKHFL